MTEKTPVFGKTILDLSFDLWYSLTYLSDERFSFCAHFSEKRAGDISLDETIDTDKDGNPLTLMDIMAVEDTILDELDFKLNSRKLRQYIEEELTDREKKIILLRYGLDGREPMTQKNVAKLMDISRSYVSRIETKALKKLKKRYDTSSNLR